MKYSRVLSIAGSDSGGGAGIQADIKTISACGSYASTAITAITAQNTLGVQEVFSLPVHIIQKQITAVLQDIGTDAVKIGMLQNADIIETVAKTLSTFSISNIILDPVMVSTSGHTLMQSEAIQALQNLLLPQALLITPNIPEAEVLLSQKIEFSNQMQDATKQLAETYKTSVLIKAGHNSDAIVSDIFYDITSKQFYTYSSERIETQNTHGTGCSLSSAIAAYVSQGFKLPIAIEYAKKYISEAIEKGATYSIGEGHGPIHHFYKFW